MALYLLRYYLANAIIMVADYDKACNKIIIRLNIQSKETSGPLYFWGIELQALVNGFCCLDNRAMEFDYHKIRILNYMKLCKKDQIMMKINGRTLKCLLTHCLLYTIKKT